MNLKKFYAQINDSFQREIPDVSLHMLIGSSCDQNPDAIASLDMHSQLSYAELNEKSDRLAAWLNSQGIGHGDLVGLCCERDANTPAWLVGILKSNAGYVPLDPDYPVDRLTYMVQDSRQRTSTVTGTKLRLAKRTPKQPRFQLTPVQILPT